jgi:hypothetical protein
LCGQVVKEFNEIIEANAGWVAGATRAKAQGVAIFVGQYGMALGHTGISSKEIFHN